MAATHDHGHGGGHGAPAAVDRDLLRSMGYEPRDVALNTLVRWLAFLFVFIGFTTAITLILYKLFVPKTAELEKVAPLAVKPAGRRLPPNPQLQASPKRDMMQFRRAEDRVLNGYTYSRAGQVALPVDSAIDQLANAGISGIRGTATPGLPTGYPGSGQYLPAPGAAAGRAPAALDDTTGDRTNAAPNASANAVNQGEAASLGGSRGNGAEVESAPNGRPGDESRPAPDGGPTAPVVASPAAPAPPGPSPRPANGGER